MDLEGPARRSGLGARARLRPRAACGRREFSVRLRVSAPASIAGRRSVHRHLAAYPARTSLREPGKGARCGCRRGGVFGSAPGERSGRALSCHGSSEAPLSNTISRRTPDPAPRASSWHVRGSGTAGTAALPIPAWWPPCLRRQPPSLRVTRNGGRSRGCSTPFLPACAYSMPALSRGAGRGQSGS